MRNIDSVGCAWDRCLGHITNPFPNIAQKKTLAAATGLTPLQVRDAYLGDKSFPTVTRVDCISSFRFSLVLWSIFFCLAYWILLLLVITGLADQELVYQLSKEILATTAKRGRFGRTLLLFMSPCLYTGAVHVNKYLRLVAALVAYIVPFSAAAILQTVSAAPRGFLQWMIHDKIALVNTQQ